MRAAIALFVNRLGSSDESIAVTEAIDKREGAWKLAKRPICVFM